MTQPRFVALIADGNGRWARRRGLAVAAGHLAGAENLLVLLRDAVALGIEELTVYAFSTENWARPTDEVRSLMALVERFVVRETPALRDDGVRVRFAGRRGDPLPGTLQEAMGRAEELTRDGARLTLCICFNYGGRAEIIDAARAFRGTTEAEFRRHLYAPELHDPEVVIRTGGERRLSNYLLWQAADAQLVFRDELWPDFDGDGLAAAIGR